MENGYLVTDEGTQEQFVAVTGDCNPLCLTVHPASLAEDDNRCIKVLLVTDTEAGESGYTTQLPKYDSEAELELWATALRVTTTIMAHLSGKEEDVTTNT